MLIELAANERAVHGDFFNSKYKLNTLHFLVRYSTTI